MNERSWNSTGGLADPEHIVWATSWLTQRVVYGIGAATEKLRKDAVATVSSGYALSFFGTIQDFFRREWIIPCLGTRVVL